MPRAIPPDIRREIVERHQRGQTLARVAADLGIPYPTVRSLWRAFRDRGADGLATGYHACGSSTPAYPESVLRRAGRLRREHPRWGAGRIRVELLEHLDASAVPSVRVLQRAFRRAGINRPRRSHRPAMQAERATAPHEAWQVDAVEKARLRTGAEVSWMSVTDQFTGGLLANELSPPGPMAVDHARRGPGPVPAGLRPLGLAGAGPGR